MILFFLLFNFAFAQVTTQQSQDLAFVNELNNPGAENGRVGWTTTNVTLSTLNWTTPSRQFGKKYFSAAFNGTVNALVEQVINVPSALSNMTCTAMVFVRFPVGTGIASYEFRILDTANVVLASTTIGQSLRNEFDKIQLNFNCPSTSTVKFRIINTVADAKTVIFDNASLIGSPQSTQKLFYSGYVRSAAGTLINIPVTDTTGYGVLSDSGLQLVNLASTIPAQIGCLAGTPSGLTCSATPELVGVELDLRRTGNYKVCASNNYDLQDNSDIANLRISIVAAISTVEVTPGNAILYVNGDSTNVSALDLMSCEIFSISVPGKYIFALRGLKLNTANVNLNFIEGGTTSTTARTFFTAQEM